MKDKKVYFMNDENIIEFVKLSGLEKAYKYIYENNLSLKDLDCESEIFKNFFRTIRCTYPSF